MDKTSTGQRKEGITQRISSRRRKQKGNYDPSIHHFLNVFTVPYTQYLADLFPPYAPSCSLRSPVQSLVDVPRTKRERCDRVFSVVALKLWNDLPLHVRHGDSLAVFKSTLKTFFFLLGF